jgi:anaerobic dimethyl sulfoxide reductase subunit B
MTQYGFLFDQDRCSGCQTCAVACKNWHSLPPGPLKYLKIYQYEKGSFPQIRLHAQWVPCYHCVTPVCIKNCPTDAIYKEPRYGAVLVESGKCVGCRRCYDACPYGAPVFDSDEKNVKAQKCDMCFERLNAGELPICVIACPTRALDFGPLNAIKQKYGVNRDIEDMPDSRITNPSVIFHPHSPKSKVVPYNEERAVELLMRRDPLPPVFTSTSNVNSIREGMVVRNRLELKHNLASDLMRWTRNDNG